MNEPVGRTTGFFDIPPQVSDTVSGTLAANAVEGKLRLSHFAQNLVHHLLFANLLLSQHVVGTERFEVLSKLVHVRSVSNDIDCFDIPQFGKLNGVHADGTVAAILND
ncbi:hypothetical protein TYRP_010927 [Tyrophagus putrescentiae]|nr:hypothetical protein TYRP_010927 [Tyrophagus putrescentiae]